MEEESVPCSKRGFKYKQEGVVFKNDTFVHLWCKDLGRVFCHLSDKKLADKICLGTWVSFRPRREIREKENNWFADKICLIRPKLLVFPSTTTLQAKDCSGMVTCVLNNKATIWNEELGRIIIVRQHSRVDWNLLKCLKIVKFDATYIPDSPRKDISWFALHIWKPMVNRSLPKPSFRECRALFLAFDKTTSSAFLNNSQYGELRISELEYYKEFHSQTAFQNELQEKKEFRVSFVPEFKTNRNWNVIFAQPWKMTLTHSQRDIDLLQSEQDKANQGKSLFEEGRNNVAAAMERIPREKGEIEGKPLRKLQDVTNDVDNMQERYGDVHILIPNKCAGAVIGLKGCNLIRLEETHNSSVSVTEMVDNSPERVITICGKLGTVLACLDDVIENLINRKLLFPACGFRMLVHQSHAGIIIGNGGIKINELREQTHASIKLYDACCPMSTYRVLQMIGEKEVILEAIRAVLALVSQVNVKGEIIRYDPRNYGCVKIKDYGGYC